MTKGGWRNKKREGLTKKDGWGTKKRGDGILLERTFLLGGFVIDCNFACGGSP